jgi:predicted Zn-dependent protease
LKLSRSRYTALALALAVLATPTQAPLAQVNLPSLGDTAGEGFGIGAERKLGDQIMADIRRDPEYLDDPLLLEYLQSIWQPLVAASQRRGNIDDDMRARFAWEPFLVRDRSVNAFALPGGFVGVHLGLIAMTGSRDELASVLAHEMSHVTQRHIARSIASSSRQSLVGLAAMILGAIAASRSSHTDALNAVVVGGQAAMAQGQLNFSRDNEREADRVGFGVLVDAGFAPGGMASMFQKLDVASRLNDGGGFPYLRSHPLTSERIGDAQTRARNAAPAPPPANPLEHAVAQARARVLMNPEVVNLRRLQALDEPGAATSPSERLIALYGSALASAQLRDWERADRAARQALALVRGHPSADARAERAVRITLAEIALQRGDAPAAARELAPLAADGGRPLLLERAQLALAGNDAAAQRASADALQTWVALQPMDGPAWSALAQTWERLGLKLRALRAEAEVRVALGDLSGAVDRLRAGQRLARSGNADFVEASVIDARLRNIEGQRRELAKEMARNGGGDREPRWNIR